MSNIQQKNKPGLWFRVFGILGLLIAILLPGYTILAVQLETQSLTAISDAFTFRHTPNLNYDDSTLQLANSSGPPGEDDKSTKAILVKFDLSAVDFEIQSARLKLTAITCDETLPLDSVNIEVYGIDNAISWDEATLKWNNMPYPPSTDVLALQNGGKISANTAQWVIWEDLYKGDLSTWLESQRNAGDESATLGLLIEKTGNPGLADVFFEDREGTAGTYGCSDAAGGPLLEISNLPLGYRIFVPLVNR